MNHVIKNVVIDDLAWQRLNALLNDMGLTGQNSKPQFFRRMIDLEYQRRFQSCSVPSIIQNACDAVQRFNPALGSVSPGMVSCVVIVPEGHIKVFFKGDSEPFRVSQAIWNQQQ